MCSGLSGRFERLSSCIDSVVPRTGGRSRLRHDSPAAGLPGHRGPELSGPAGGNASSSLSVLWRTTTGMTESKPVGRRPGRPPSTPPIADVRPDLVLEWDRDRNGDLTPSTVSSGSQKKIWWKCAEGPDHRWQATPANRIGVHTGCPYCAGRRTSITNSLVQLRPDLAAEWDPEENSVPVGELVLGSNRIGYWICREDTSHRWKAKVAARVKRGSGCPYCSGRRVSSSTSLAALEPDLVREWHPTRNGSLTPADVRSGSSKRVWWRCRLDPAHEWQVAVAERARAHRTGCPFCKGRRARAELSLERLRPDLAAQWHPIKNGASAASSVTLGSERLTWWLCPVALDHEWQSMPARRVQNAECPFCNGRRPSSTSSLAAANPAVASEWHPSLNPLRADQVTPRSQTKAWWRCREDPRHEWEAIIRNRAILGNGCPYCSGFWASANHSLLVKHPNAARSWHPTRNYPLTPADVPPAAKRAVWWKCPKGPDHEWKGPVFAAAAAGVAAGDGAGCPFCACRRLSITNRLSDTFPELAKEWHSSRNGSLTPDQVVHGTPRRVWWQCSANPLHEWRTGIVARTRAGSGCPYCTLAPRSLQEILLAFELQQFVPFDINDHKIMALDGGIQRMLDVDMVLRTHRTVVEFDGSYWHKEKAKADRHKTQLLTSAGWRVIRIREHPLPLLNSYDVQVPEVATAGAKRAADIMLTHVSRVLALDLDLSEYLARPLLRAEDKARRHALRLRSDPAKTKTLPSH